MYESEAQRAVVLLVTQHSSWAHTVASVDVVRYVFPGRE